MSLHRFHLPPEHASGALLELTEREAHHASQVLRLRPGERAVVLDGAGTEILCDVSEVSRKSVKLIPRQRLHTPPPRCPITLCQAVPKGKLMETIVQKATELGASRIVPILSERVAVQLDDDSAADKQEKWQLTAIEAIKQCGSPWLPKIGLPVSPRQALAEIRSDLSLVGSLQDDSRHPREYFEAFRSERGQIPSGVVLWIGPEGDFTPAEMVEIKGAGARPVTLGKLVLRCETAAVYALSVVNYELQWQAGRKA